LTNPRWGRGVADLETHDGFVGFADLCQMRLKLKGNRSKRLVKMMTDDVLCGGAEDVFRGFVGKRDLVLHIRCDDAAGDGLEDVVHQVLEGGHFFEGVFERGEQARIFDGDCGLVCESCEQVFFAFGEDACADAVVGIDDADEFVFDFERHAQDGTQVECDDAFLTDETLVFLCIGGDNGFARIDHTLHNGAADVLLR
jgi:hypothetical protein